MTMVAPSSSELATRGVSPLRAKVSTVCEPKAQAMFDILTSQNRYAILYRLHNATRAETRARRIEQFVTMLARGETIYPQKRVRDE